MGDAQIMLVGSDLLRLSQLETAVRHAGGTFAVAADDGELTGLSGASAVLVDLNSNAASRCDLVRRIHETHPDIPIIGFCSHGDGEVRRQAMAAGASQVVTNGAIHDVAIQQVKLEVQQ